MEGVSSTRRYRSLGNSASVTWSLHVQSPSYEDAYTEASENQWTVIVEVYHIFVLRRELSSITSL